ncbi:tetratricopeptide (TPR) repeat protein [Allocatelliglobosispora scoriae]|uniref:Tetratricopeptide (TPR) repeat protein n=1 Tax=Allocatelliglobosispora scoriae TaxID=643052 RepID=A0A841BQM7_9ACTN|nr:XRE family transcriptional regulator [Allocatelliglobosispora scoriae]MBB5869120.1 tetratricopeptide (TPR) repeat protein [Allocatelliglobosispora scoriae]
MGDLVRGSSKRPAWAQRIKAERTARGWSQTNAVAALRTNATQPLAGDGSLLRNWKRWEAGDAEPDGFYKPLIAKTFGTVTAAIFPNVVRRSPDAELLTDAGLDTLEIVSRLRVSDVSQSTLDALHIAVDRLCCDYPHVTAEQLHRDGQAWLHRITSLLDRRLTLAQHQQVLNLAGWVALLVGCVEYDLGRRQQAEATRQAALSLGLESGSAQIQGWAHEMRAWYALTRGDYLGVIAATETGEAVAPNQSVAVQLAAQRAKAWARLGNRKHAAEALDQGRALLEKQPYPDNLDHHFIVDPAKFDFYAMDCYRLLGDDNLAGMYANEVIKSSTDFDGFERRPMRLAEARITLGVIAGREGNLDKAVEHGTKALSADRQSIPSLVMCSQELRELLQQRYPNEPQTQMYMEKLSTLASTAAN